MKLSFLNFLGLGLVNFTKIQNRQLKRTLAAEAAESCLYLEWGPLGPLAHTAPPQARGATVLGISQEPGPYLPPALLPKVDRLKVTLQT